MGQPGFWDIEARQQKLEQKQDFLVHLNQMMPWENFRGLLNQARQKLRKSRAGCKPADVVLLSKLLVLQKLYNISDKALKYQVNNRFSFMLFLGLGFEDKAPDATTVWLFREQLQHGVVEQLFEHFEQSLQQAEYQARDGQIVDATLISVPKQHNCKAENQHLRQGQGAPECQGQPHKLSQKDVDARWTKKLQNPGQSSALQ
ncbi:MAG: transposase [Cyanobacteria bacterium P01_D01_bin.56]